MIFLGDVAHPFRSTPRWRSTAWPWRSQAAVANLEGPLVTDASRFVHQRALVNDISVVDALKAANVGAVTLANNHITDVPGGVGATRQFLMRYGISAIGAGRTSIEAAAPVVVEDGTGSYALIGFGWEVIGCRRVNESREGVNPLLADMVFRLIEQAQQAHPRSRIVLLMHWNYEMEPYPQPAHRQLAMAAIDAGASAVVGHHPHCAGGVEMYKDCPIAYSLGNWWIPHGAFFAGRLSYPQYASLQLALEWLPGHEPIVHWFEYQPEGHRLVRLESEAALTSARIRKLTPFAGMSHRDYVAWFRRHRMKRKALPIYKDFTARRTNRLKDGLVWARGLALDVFRHFA